MSIKDSAVLDEQLGSSVTFVNSPNSASETNYSSHNQTSQITMEKFQKSAADKSLSQNATRDSSCKFFFSAKGCAMGELCKYSHALPEEATAMSNSDYPASGARYQKNSEVTAKNTRPPCRFYAAGYCKWGNR